MVNVDPLLGRRAVLLGTVAGATALALSDTAAKAAAAVEPRRGGSNPTGLRGLGIVYDTGFYSAGPDVRSTHEPFDLKTVRKDMKAIAKDLNATAVRVVGGNADRLEAAAEIAADLGLQVWYSPFPCDLTQPEMRGFLADSARRAERLRIRGHDVVYVAGSEIGLFIIGFLPGATIHDRLAFLLERGPDFFPAIAALPGKVNAFFAEAVPRVRDAFGGPITYASIDGLERVDWTPFDIIGADTYRDAATAATFTDQMAQFVARGAAMGKLVAVTESGCGTYDGAADVGGRADLIVEYDTATNTALRLKEEVRRDEAEQAQCIEELVTVYDEVGVHTAFVQTFAMRHLPYRPDAAPTLDLDRAGYGIVRPLEDGHGWRGHRWEPKEAYFRVGDLFRSLRRS